MTNQEIKLLHERIKKEDPKLLVLMEKCFDAGVLFGKEQAQRTWVNATTWRGLTDEEIDELSRTMVKGNKSVNWLCRAIEAKLKEKNT